MKRITNLFSKFGVALSILSVASLVIVPASSLALGKDISATSTTPKTSPFCSNISSYANGINSKLSDLRAKVTQAWAQQDQKLATDQQNVDQKISTERQTADTNRATDFTKLTTKATTSNEKLAVQTYESSVNADVATRRAAYDSARQTFRNGLAADISSRRHTITGQLSTFQSSVNTAITTAETSCASNPNEGQSARTAFVASLKAARATYQSQRSGDGELKQEVQQLTAIRDGAFNSAEQTFMASQKTARQILSQAFGKSNGTI